MTLCAPPAHRSTPGTASGQNTAGTVIDVTDAEGQWLIDRRQASTVDSGDEVADEDLEGMTKAALQTIAEDRGVSTTGSKAELRRPPFRTCYRR